MDVHWNDRKKFFLHQSLTFFKNKNFPSLTSNCDGVHSKQNSIVAIGRRKYFEL